MGSPPVATLASFVWPALGFAAPMAVANPTDACAALSNAGGLDGRVVLVEGGGECLFVDKARRVQAAGGVLMLVGISAQSGSDGATAEERCQWHEGGKRLEQKSIAKVSEARGRHGDGEPVKACPREGLHPRKVLGRQRERKELRHHQDNLIVAERELDLADDAQPREDGGASLQPCL